MTEVTFDTVVNALLLTEFVEVDLDVVRSWTAGERQEALSWAQREHLHASDHDDVERLPCPPHVVALRSAAGTRMAGPWGG